MTNRFHKLELEESKLPQATAAEQQQKQQQSVSLSNVQADLHDAGYWMRVADQGRRRGEFEEALRSYSRAVELDRSLAAGWLGQVQMLVALGEFPEAELWARKALELFRGHGDLMAARAQALCRTGDTKTAQPACDAALAQPGLSPYPWMVRGELMLVRKDASEQYCFDKAVQLDPDWLVLVEIAAIYVYYKRHAKALTRCRQATEKAPDQAYCWFRQGECELAMGLSGAAQKSFKQCLDLEPKHRAARLAMESARGRSRWSLRGLLRRG